VQVDGKFRLRKSADFKRVRRSGRSFAHPLVVLIVRPNELESVRIGVSAGRSVGNAVQRNRAKRRLRALLQPLAAAILPGHDIVVLARKSIGRSSPEQLDIALRQLSAKAGILRTTET